MKFSLALIRQLWPTLCSMGPRNAWRRICYEVQKRSGLLKMRLPVQSWEQLPPRSWLRSGVPQDAAGYMAWRSGEDHPRFLFDPQSRPTYASHLENVLGDGKAASLAEVAQMEHGVFTLFARHAVDLGWPPDWHLNPFTGQRTPSHRHWSDIPGYSVQFGDLKLIWEASRFACTHKLVRAYWVTGDEQWARMFQQLIEDWRAHNPPQAGANWWCGQELAIRAMAWIFGFYGFSQSSVAERVGLPIVQSLSVFASRIERTIEYAVSQNNNHTISEAVALWTIGILFAELRYAERWRRRGEAILIQSVLSQFAADGSYVQHSFNYQRLALQNLIWAVQIGDLNGYVLPESVRERMRASFNFLYQLQDGETGRLPNYGPNDGALILPLNECDFLDYRPLLNAGHYLTTGRRLYPRGAWDEDLLWFFGPDALTAPQDSVPRCDIAARDGGYYVLRSPMSFAFIRCTSYETRPAQADILNLDIWWRHRNVALDAGTFSYTSIAPWNNGLASTSAHNTVTVDGLDQMVRGPRFIWTQWTQSKARTSGYISEQYPYFEGEHYGYRQLHQPVTHRRAVLRVDEETWLVVDDLLGEGTHRFRLHWLLEDVDYDWDSSAQALTLHWPDRDYKLHWWGMTPVTSDLVRGHDLNSTRGWQSRYYYDRQPALSLACEATATCPYRILTLFGPTDAVVQLAVSDVQVIRDGRRHCISLARPALDVSTVVASVRVKVGAEQFIMPGRVED